LKGWEYDPAKTTFGMGAGQLPVIATYLCCDPSIGKKTEQDPTAISLVYKVRVPSEQGYTFFIADLKQGHWTMHQRIDELQKMSHNGLRVSKCRIEGISGFQDFVGEVKRSTNLPVQEINYVKDKISVLESKSHFFENRHVRISNRIPEKIRQTLEYQLTTNHPRNDDLRDAVFLGMDDNSAGTAWIGADKWDQMQRQLGARRW